MYSVGLPITVSNLQKAFPNLSKSKAKLLVKIKIEDPEDYLELANELLGGYGVESARVGDRSILYVNMGDTYDNTIIYDEEEFQYRIGSWGDWVEAKLEQRSEELLGDE